MHNLIIRNGRVLDPHNEIDEVIDIVVENGRISKLGKFPGTGSDDEYPSVDASGCIVTPGLVDCHVHAYQHATPLGIDVDRTCLARGVTAVVDAGSAGSATFPGLRHFIARPATTRLYCFLHIAQQGLANAGCVAPGGGGEIDSLNVVNVSDCVQVIQENRDMVVGIKLRLATDISDNGRNEQEAYRRAIAAAREAEVPLMVHHARSGVPHTGVDGGLGCPGSLQAGDVYTHCYHGHGAGIIDVETGRVATAYWEARRRGVLFDLGHGRGSFFWRVAEQCAAEGFWPDIVSTDLHTQCQDGPAYDLPCAMSRMLNLGMPLYDVIRAVTSRPAAAIGKLTEIGHLSPGMPADVTVLRLDHIREELEDVEGVTRVITRAVTPVAVVRGGQQFPVLSDRRWPNQEVKQKMAAIIADWSEKDKKSEANVN